MNIETIHAYINGALSGTELQEFEARLLKDSELKQEVDIQREMLAHMELSHDVNRALDAINQVQQEFEAPPEMAVDRRWFIAGIFLVVALGLLGLYKYISSDTANDIEYASLFELPAASFSTKGNATEELLANAAVAYNKQAYSEAIDYLDQATQSDPNNPGEILFYKALSEIGNNNYSSAIPLLEGLKEQYPLFSEDADWYRAVAYWQSGDKESAARIFRTFTEGNYGKKAERILELM